MAVGVHCIVYDWWVTGLYAVTMFPGWLYQAQRTLSAKAQLVSSVETPLMPEGQTVKLSALAVPAPTREPMVTAAPIPAAARAFFIVRDFFSFAFVCRSVRLALGQLNSPSASKANLAICPSRRPACPEAATITPAYLR